MATQRRKTAAKKKSSGKSSRGARKPASRKAQVVDRIRTLKDAVQAAIDNGATSVQEVHQHIAAMSFDKLEKIAAIEGLVMKARDAHDRSMGSVYDTIRAVNARAGELAEAALNRIGQGDS